MRKSIKVIFISVIMMIVFTSSAFAQGTLSVGARGSAVTALQNDLKSLNYQVGTVDGIFGQQTKQAVISFQRDNKLSVDGIVGPKTIEAIKSKLNGNTTTPVNRGTTTTTQTKVESIISIAKSFIGVPYVTAGTTPSGFDCSGYTQYVMNKNGMSIPRTAASQFTIGTTVSRSNLQPGDLVFFQTYKVGASHVGFYIGNNNFISATTSQGVVISSLSNAYWNPRYIGAKRILQ